MLGDLVIWYRFFVTLSCFPGLLREILLMSFIVVVGLFFTGACGEPSSVPDDSVEIFAVPWTLVAMPWRSQRGGVENIRISLRSKSANDLQA